MKLEPVIGLEVHAQLKTRSKIFCGCPTDFGATANDHVCPVCLGLPGVLPVLNQRALELAIRAGLALNCQISARSKFDRKNYFYPDLPKAYQISQYDEPICRGGHLTVDGNTVRINRAHLEEDAGKLVHAGAAGLHGSDYSLVDYNRCGVPLLEIVSEPDIRSPEQARQYLLELRSILRYIDVCDGNLEEGSFRCDANVSLRPAGASELGTKTEIKNMNSFKAVQRAIQSEIDRQAELIERGERIVQETRLWNEPTGKTHPMRSKEEAHDYRYFPEPDLVPLVIDRQWVDDLRRALPELPESRRQRYTSQCGLPADDAAIIAESKEMSDFYDACLAAGAPARSCANLLIGPALAYMKEKKVDIGGTRLTPTHLQDLIAAVESGQISSTASKQVLADLLAAGGDVQAIVSQKGLLQLSDEASIREIAAGILSASPDQLADYRSGKTKVRQFFFGETMKATEGKANPQIINKVLDELLGGSGPS